MKIYEPRLKLALVFAVVLLPLALVKECVGQQVTVIKTDSSKVSGRVGARSATAIYVNNQMIGHKEIAIVKIEETGPQAGTLIEYLNKYSVNASQVGSGIVSSSTKVVMPITVNEVDLRMEKFARQRDTGKGLQALGIIVGLLGPVLADNNLETARAFAISGAAISLVGFGIDIDASKHLRKSK